MRHLVGGYYRGVPMLSHEGPVGSHWPFFTHFLTSHRGDGIYLTSRLDEKRPPPLAKLQQYQGDSLLVQGYNVHYPLDVIIA